MNISKIVAGLVLGSLAPISAIGEEFININLGVMQANYKLEGVGSNGASTVDLRSNEDDSGAVFGGGLAFLYDNAYFTINLLLPYVDSDTWIILEASPHYYFANNMYAGVTAGFQKYESSDQAGAQSIGASQSKITLSGINAGLSFGRLFKDGAMDLNFKFRFLNGREENINGSFSGVSYDVDAKVERTFHLSLGYNFPINL